MSLVVVLNFPQIQQRDSLPIGSCNNSYLFSTGHDREIMPTLRHLWQQHTDDANIEEHRPNECAKGIEENTATRSAK